MIVLPQIPIAEGAPSITLPPPLCGALTGDAFDLGGMLPFFLILAVFYFLVLRPMSKQEKDRKQRLAELKRGDEVVLAGGILGRISKIDGEIATIELGEKVRIRVLKKDIADLQSNVLGKDDKDKDKDKDAEKSKDADKKDTEKGKDADKGTDDGDDKSRRAG